MTTEQRDKIKKLAEQVYPYQRSMKLLVEDKRSAFIAGAEAF